MSQGAPADRLEELFALQGELAGMVGSGRYPGDAEGRVSALATAIVHEAVELQRTTSWKWWKRPSRFDAAAAREELVDIWHFVIQASIELGMSPGDVVREYRRKNEINRGRQRGGY